MVSPNLGATLVVVCCVLLVRAEDAVVAAEHQAAKKNSANSASVVRQERPIAERSEVDTPAVSAEDEDAVLITEDAATVEEMSPQDAALMA